MDKATHLNLNAIICTYCGKKIGEMKIKEGIVALVCQKCKKTNIIEITPTQHVKNVK